MDLCKNVQAGEGVRGREGHMETPRFSPINLTTQVDSEGLKMGVSNMTTIIIGFYEPLG